MKRFAKHLLPLCMMLTVAAAPGASFAAQPDSGSDQKDIGTYQHFSQWMNRGPCGLGQNGSCNSCDLSQPFNRYPGQSSQCGDLSPDRPGCSGSDNGSGGNNCTGGTGCPNLPGNQEQPQKPEKPNLPGDQEQPQKPEKPNLPGDQEQPQKPEKPNLPGNQEQPQKPEKPNLPSDQEQPQKPDVNIGSYQSQVVSLVNQERTKQGLSPLKINDKLSDVATKKAQDMRDKGYFSHTSPTYGSPFDMMKQFGITYSSAGENIAKGQKTPEAVMNGWMNSQDHRDNILNSRYTEIGVGYVTDGSGNTYWVQMFIRP